MISVSELARRLNVTRQCIHNWGSKGYVEIQQPNGPNTMCFVSDEDAAFLLKDKANLAMAGTPETLAQLIQKHGEDISLKEVLLAELGAS